MRDGHNGPPQIRESGASHVNQLSLTPEPAHEGDPNDEWSTPLVVVRELEHEFGPFDLDPCATPETAKAPRYFTKVDDGLTQPWAGRVWCNPPYSNKGAWARKAYEESLNGCLVVCLLPARTDTPWFHDWVQGKAEIRFRRGRILFYAMDGSGRRLKPRDGEMIVIYHPKEVAA